MHKVIIIDYGSGNLRSAAKAFERAAEGKDIEILVTDDASQLATATHIVLPGVGAFADCMSGLNSTVGMRNALEKEVLGGQKPFLGICVGMQLLFEVGHEHGIHKGLGWIAGEVVKIAARNEERGTSESTSHLVPRASRLKIPHMGWNELSFTAPDHPLVRGIAHASHAYFVHSFHALCSNPADSVATTDYGQNLTAIVAHDNIMGTQFHPEKSQSTGLKLIENFLEMGVAGSGCTHAQSDRST